MVNGNGTHISLLLLSCQAFGGGVGIFLIWLVKEGRGVTRTETGWSRVGQLHAVSRKKFGIGRMYGCIGSLGGTQCAEMYLLTNVAYHAICISSE